MEYVTTMPKPDGRHEAIRHGQTGPIMADSQTD